MLEKLLRCFGPPPSQDKDAVSIRTRLPGRVLNAWLVAALGIFIFYPESS